MNVNIIYYILIVILVLVDIFLYIDEILNNPSSKIYKAKIEKKTFIKNGYKYILDENYVVIDVPNDQIIEILDEIENKKITNINLDKTVICTKFIIGTNINVIAKLDLKCEEVENKSVNFKIEDGIIFDKFNNVICIFKEKQKEELFEIAKKYSIRRDALRYFTNAKYYQFVYSKGMFDIRLSKPYYDNNEHLFAIIPNKVNEKEIDSVTINFNYIDYLYLPKTVKNVLVEKKCEFDNLDIDKSNNYLTIYKNSLLNKNTLCFITDGFNTLNKIGTTNKTDVKCNYKRLSRNYTKLNKFMTYVLVANDLQ